MKINKSLLNKAVAVGIINTQQAEQLWQLMIQDEETQTPFNFVNLLFYLGGFIAICSVTFLVSPYIINLGRWGLVSVLFAYGIGAFGLSQYFLKNKFSIPAALCLIFIVSLTPIFLSSLQYAIWVNKDPNPIDIFKFFSLYQDNYFYIELGTWIVNFLFFLVYRFSILLLPLCLISWYLSSEIIHLIFGFSFSFSIFFKTSIIFGMICIITAIYLDIKNKKPYIHSFWLYIVGVFSFWLGYTNQLLTNTEWSWFGFALMNFILLCLGTIFLRRVFLVFGSLGIFIFLGHIIYELFTKLNINWLLGSLILTLLGLFLIKIGMLIHQHHPKIKIFINQFLPSPFKIFLEHHDE